MAFKFVALAALIAAANAGLLPAAPLTYAAAPAGPLTYASGPVALAPVAKTVVAKTVDADYDPHPQYSYAYDVHDTLTGDAKSQQETRDGDVVQGSYSLIEADGTKRIVDYTADPVNGFNAVVHKEPAAVAVAAAPVAKIAAPVAYAAPVSKYIAHAPVLAKVAAPVAVAHAAPVAVAHGAPLAYAAHPAPLAKIASPFAYAAPGHYL